MRYPTLHRSLDTRRGHLAVLIAALAASGCTVGEPGDDTFESPAELYPAEEFEADEEDALDVELQVAGGGREIPDTRFKAVGVVRTTGGCTGTIISRRWVLTAAHCFDTWLEDDGRLTSDEIARASFEQTGKGIVAGVTAVHIHPFYSRDERFNRWDIALMRVDRRMRPSIKMTRDTVARDEWFRSVGYGCTTQDCRDFGTKRTFNNQVDEVDEHHYQYNNNTHRGTRPTSCFGDSGGPMMVRRDGRWRIAGIISRFRRGHRFEGCHDSDHYNARLDIAAGWLGL